MPDRSLSNRVAGTYATAGTLWILAGSGAADSLFGADIAALGSFELLKGLFFVGATALGLRWLVHKELGRWHEAEAERGRVTERLVLLVDQAVDALSYTLGQRDPYTAEHQQRVAALSVAVAYRMGLTEDRIAAIRIGALLHDVGKIGIPAELLSKPGRLNSVEFSLIQEHARIGKGIVAKIDFDAAVHAVVGQHHERLDGSGYPDGLHGDAISLEARIVAVADVVEAMTSHRPYRPGLGLAAARSELQALRGTKLDAVVVDACLSIMESSLDSVWPEGGGASNGLRRTPST